MRELSVKIKAGLSILYNYASDRFRQDMIDARTEFDRLVPIPPVNDTEMHGRLVMFSHWFLMDRHVRACKTPANMFYEEGVLSFSYEEEEVYRALKAGSIGIYEVAGRHQNTAVDVATDERFGFIMEDEAAVQPNKDLMTMRFVRLREGVFLLASYCTHHYSTKGFIRSELGTVSRFDKMAFSAKVLELSALSIKSRKYDWVAPMMIYKGMTKL
ncbi:MAG: hypothetical protein M1491_03660 [Deltaproteobacteria bacterium]|nr:hypothetical protein [Deltaproteobacteria bacterium]MCL5278258.1 hypothetical protein [Deltaproteobacteria bacterium]